MRMPFGKHCGLDIEDLPDDYIDWLITIDMRPRLRNAVEREYRGRHGHDQHSYQRDERNHHDHDHQDHRRDPSKVIIAIEPSQVSLVQEVFASGFRVIAKKKHPDHGGADDDMRRLIEARESVQSQLGGGR